VTTYDPNNPALTPEQDKAFAFLNDRYGDARWNPTNLHFATHTVKIEGVDEDGEVRARWIVRPDGKISGAWDPDYVVEHYLRTLPPQRTPIRIPEDYDPSSRTLKTKEEQS
jgi:hypothetical protein